MPKTAGHKHDKVSALTAEEMTAFLEEVFPEVMQQGTAMRVERVGYGNCSIRLTFQLHQLRPGGTISGPTMMGLADFAVYVAVLSAIGRVPLAVTSSLNINFFKKPPAKDLIAECKLLKIGKRLCVGEALLIPDGEDEPVAHAVATYAIPAEKTAERGLSPTVG